MPSCRFLACAALASLTLLGACASTHLAHTPGEIPRDTYGKPIWSLIEPSVPQRVGG